MYDHLINGFYFLTCLIIIENSKIEKLFLVLFINNIVLPIICFMIYY